MKGTSAQGLQSAQSEQVSQGGALELSCRWCVRCLNWQQDQRESEIGREPVWGGKGIGSAKKGKTSWNLSKSQTWNLSVVSVFSKAGVKRFRSGKFSIPEHYEY